MFHYLFWSGISFWMLAMRIGQGRLLIASSFSSFVARASSVPSSNVRWVFPEIPSGWNDTTSSSLNDRKEIHVIVLIHGWMGNAKELSVLQSYLQEAASQRLVVHSVTSNEGRTMDGIAAGGTRCAEEIEALLQHVMEQSSQLPSKQNEEQRIALSIIGNSLGGLYARYAVGHLSFARKSIRPAVFATICTPHLGVGTPHLPLGLGGSMFPHWIQTGVAELLGPTGRDLFRTADSNIWSELHHPTYQEPLRRFRRRLAVANLHQTDLQVPGTTAAFLQHPTAGATTESSAQHTLWTSPINDTHYRIRGSGVSFMMETTPTISSCSADEMLLVETTDRVASSNAMASHLNTLGWVKIFCDMRPHLPDLFSWFGGESSSSGESIVPVETLSDAELWRKCAETTHRTLLPVGHTMLVANAKNTWYARLHQAGRPTMEHLAQLLLHEMHSQDDETEGRNR